MPDTLRIGLDLKTLSLGYAGIGRYTINLVPHLLNRDRFSYFGFSAANSDLSLLSRSQQNRLKLIGSRVKSSVVRSAISLPYHAHQQKLHLFHSMDNSTVGIKNKTRYKRVSTIHDLIVFQHPEFFTRKHAAIVKRMTAHAARMADHIIADSYSTKNDLLQNFPFLVDKKISVIHLGSPPEFTKASEKSIANYLRATRIPKHYLLSLATREPRKNLKNLSML